jgi:triosephosphate isomerase
VASNYGQTAADRFRVLYGGSVKPDNVQALMEEPNVDGGLVGGASMEADVFSQLVRYYRV